MSDFQNVGPITTRASNALLRFFGRHLTGVKTVYDHGCGYGGWTHYISAMTGAKMAIFDPDEAATDHTKTILGDRLIESDGPFDAIMCFGVLELLEEQDQIALLQKFKSQLTGRLLVQYNFYNPFALRWIAMRLLHGNPKNWHEAHRFHRTYFPRKYVEGMFQKAGFKILEKCHPVLEGHLPFAVNSVLGPIVPSAFHMTFYYALEPQI